MIYDTLEAISNTTLIDSGLKFCLVDSNKRPFKVDGTMAKPNNVNDFVEFEDLLQCSDLESYAGVGISVQASNICAIDVDHCFSKPFDITSGDDRANDLIYLLGPYNYIEFSFSGKGMRILCQNPIIENYSDKYYIKNESNQMEYYQPTKSFRYVTVTGKVIKRNLIRRAITQDIFVDILNEYFLKPEKKQFDVFTTTGEETRSFEELMKLVKYNYLSNTKFQNLWFVPAPGSGSNESERDYEMVCYLFENITQDKDMIKRIFEESEFFKSKDWKHVNKWKNQDYRYFNYLYSVISRKNS